MIVRDKIRKIIEIERNNGQKRIPSERKLAEITNCSRMEVCKVLSHFELEGLIERRHGSGTFLVENQPDRRLLNIALGLRRVYHSCDQYFLNLTKYLSKLADESNLHLQIFDNLTVQFDHDPVNNSLVRSIRSKIVDGVLLISRFPVKHLGSLIGLAPLAMINNNLAGYMDVPSVCCDHFQSGFLAVRHLIRNGHRRIGYVCEGLERPDVYMHRSGMNCVLQEHGLPPLKDDAILTLTSNTLSRPKQMREYLNRVEPTAVFARNDMVASTVIRLWETMNIRVPEDISIIGEGNFSWGGQPDVSLTTIDTQLPRVCELGLNLIRKLCNDEDCRVYTSISPKLIERQSVRVMENAAYES